HSGLGLRAGGRNEIGFRAVAGLDFEADSGRTILKEKFSRGVDYFQRDLMRDEAHGELGAGPGGYDGLAAFALVAAGKAVDFEGGPGGALFDGSETAFTKQLRDTEEFAIGFLASGKAGELLFLKGGERRDVIVKTGDGD